jgi:hypothetical protein
MIQGQPYYLAVTNPNARAISFSLGVWFDIIGLTNCTPMTNFVGPAGIPRYFQFDVPTNRPPDPDVPQEVVFWLSGVTTNVTVVLSQHLPLPDLGHYDYISQSPCTNDEVLMVVTNTTPFPLQTNTWYVGIFNTGATNVPFTVQACYRTNYPVLIPLTNGIPYVATFANPYVAPPGPPQWFFFEFNVTNVADAILFELYDMSGDLDLVLQRDLPPGMATYFDGSFRLDRTPEQIVLRTGWEMADLRGHWYLGLYNNETTNVAYTVRAVTQGNGILPSGQPLRSQLVAMSPPHGMLLQWNAVEGETYLVEFTTSILPPIIWQPVPWAPGGGVIATTPCATLELPASGAFGFYRVRQVARLPALIPPLSIRVINNTTLRISWPISFPNETLQYSTTPAGPWYNSPRPVTVEGNEFVVYDTIASVPFYYRLVP